MCGISGVIRKTCDIDLKLTIEAMTDVISHRGPDGHGYYFDSEGNFAFGHRRLAILDLTENAHQPMCYADDQLVVTYNGEIYNYLEIRAELEQFGHVFHSESDTEVLLAAYQQWGKECVMHFNGMWAFAIHDVARNVLFCSRDRFGVKPFYYANFSTGFAFGSEIKQLLQFLPQRKANRDVLLNFLVTGLTDRVSHTFFTGIEQLPGGHNLIYRLDTHDFSIDRYYQIQIDHSLENIELPEAEDAFSKSFINGVTLRLRSDVKVGTCLSGGMDSSSIATLAARIYHEKTGGKFAAITAVSTQAGNDESQFAQAIVESEGMEWITVTPTYEDFLGAIEEIVRVQEEPFGSPSIVMQYFVMKAARENGIPVLLDGQGGDETLLGYPIYYGVHIASTYRKHGLFAAIRALRDAGSNSSESILNVVKYVIGTANARIRYWLYRWRHRYLRSLLPLPQGLVDYAKATLDQQTLQDLEITQTNMPVLLRYEDKNSMAHSVETRLPFLDYRTLELALSLPGKFKIRDGWTKWILRKVMADKMPAEIVWRKNKFGFEAPEQQWLARHANSMRECIRSSALLEDLCDMEKLEAMYDGMSLRTKWRLYSIAMWEQAYELDG